MRDVLISREEVVKAVDRHTREGGKLDDDITCILEEIPDVYGEKEIKLRKCPFCGEEISLIKQKCLNTGFKCYKLFHGSEKRCVLNDVMLPRVYENKIEAIKAWNKREG